MFEEAGLSGGGAVLFYEGELLDYVRDGGSVCWLVEFGVVRVERIGHVDACKGVRTEGKWKTTRRTIQPHLVGIDFFMPETT